MGEEAVKKKGWSLQGMTALVTGGTKGIGHAIVEELAAFGASVHTCARIKAELDQCLHEWKESGFNVTGSVCDVSVGAARQKLMDEASSIFQGKLNIFLSVYSGNCGLPSGHTMLYGASLLLHEISNAAAFIFKPTLEITAEEFSFVMATNLESTYHLSQLAHPLLKASGQGNIVFIPSTAGLVGSCAGTFYAASKGALNQLTKNLACEWAKDNIRTNCVAPWVTKTPLIEDLLANKELVDEMIPRTPLRRFAEPKEVSSLVAFLCLPVASYINGQVIAVDGGFTINGFYPSKDYY